MWFSSKKKQNEDENLTVEEKEKKEKLEKEKKNEKVFAERKDIKDLIAPGGIDATFTNHLEIISTKFKFARSLVVTTLPRTTTFPELFRGLYEANDANTSIFINPISNERSLKTLNSQINEIESEIIVARNRHDVNRERVLEIKKEELEQWIDKIDAGYDSMFTSSIITTAFAPNMEGLDLSTSQIMTEVAAKLITIKPAWAIQDQAFESNLPYNDNKIMIEHNFDKGSMGTVFPFITSEVGHTTGIPLGFNLSTGLPILFNNFDKNLENYNMVIFGKSGARKRCYN